MVIEIKVVYCNILKSDELIDIGYAANEEVMKYKQKTASSGSAQHVALSYKHGRQMLEKLCSHLMTKYH